MSTTITYKGATLASFTNATKKMLTAGKYMEDDVTIIDSEQDELPVGWGHTHINFNTMGISWSTSAEEGV